MTQGWTLEACCASVGLDPAVALLVPPWFSEQPPAGVDSSAIRPPIHGYRALLEQHVRRELRITDRRIVNASNPTHEGAHMTACQKQLV